MGVGGVTGIAIWRFWCFVCVCVCVCERISWMGVLVELLLCGVGGRWLVGWCEMR